MSGLTTATSSAYPCGNTYKDPSKYLTRTNTSSNSIQVLTGIIDGLSKFINGTKSKF